MQIISDRHELIHKINKIVEKNSNEFWIISLLLAIYKVIIILF